LIPLWCSIVEVNVYVKKYQTVSYYFLYTIAILRIISWSGIVFLNNHKENFMTFSLFSGLTVISRSYAKEAFKIRMAAQNARELKTDGAYKKDHSATTDLAEEKNGLVPFIAGNTHGKGSIKNPSKEIHSSQDLKGDAKPQLATFPKKTAFLSKKDLGSVIANSKEYFEQPEVKTNVDKHLLKLNV
jgi:hypothetical protein